MRNGETSRQRLSLMQRVVTRLMPARADEIERQSREPFIVCGRRSMHRVEHRPAGE